MLTALYAMRGYIPSNSPKQGLFRSMLKQALRNFILFFAFLICGAALADEASVRKLVEAKLGTKVQSVTKFSVYAVQFCYVYGDYFEKK